MSAEVKLPGNELAHRPLHVIFITDCSGSMSADGKIQTLNTAIKEAIPHMQDAAKTNPTAQVFVRAIKFSDGASWHITSTSVDQFQWKDLDADGRTDMGKALEMVSDELTIPPMPDRALPPVLILVSDGQPTDNFAGGLDKLENTQWGKKAVRISIAIGKDADEVVLKRFNGEKSEIPVLKANNPDQLVKYIKWASTVPVKAVANSKPQNANSVVTLQDYAAKAPVDNGTSDNGIW